MNDGFEGLETASFVTSGDSPLDKIREALDALQAVRACQSLPPQMVEQLERAAFMAGFSYNKPFDSDAEVLKFLLDRLERVEDVNSAAYEAVRAIDWAI